MTAERAPELVRLVAEHCGWPAAVALVKGWGGVRLYVPATIDPDHDLAKAMGVEAADCLVNLLGVGHVDVPIWRAARARAKAKLVLALRAEKCKLREICRAADMTERRVFQILAEARKARAGDPDQLDFFAA